MTCLWTPLAVVSALGTLLGCAQLGTQVPSSMGAPGAFAQTRSELPVKVVTPPTVAVLPAVPSAESFYAMGRAAHGSGHLSLARAHYAQALAINPRHVGALNAMAVIQAQEGLLDDALKLFNQAMAIAPQAAHLYNNAGYALLRAGRLADAEVALLRARELDSSNQHAVQNLALLRTERERVASVQMPASQAQPGKQEQAEGPKLVSVAPQIYALLPGMNSPDAEAPIAVPTAALPGAVIAAPLTKPLRGVRVEVANGAGVSRLARRTAERLAPTGLVAARLTNVKPYRQAITEIQFAANQEKMVELLRSYLPLDVKAISVTNLQPGIQIRLVLGHDLTGKVITAWLDGRVDDLHATWQKDRGWDWS